MSPSTILYASLSLSVATITCVAGAILVPRALVSFGHVVRVKPSGSGDENEEQALACAPAERRARVYHASSPSRALLHLVTIILLARV